MDIQKKKDVGTSVELAYGTIFPNPNPTLGLLRTNVEKVLDEAQINYNTADNQDEYFASTPSIASKSMSDSEFDWYNNLNMKDEFKLENLINEIGYRLIPPKKEHIIFHYESSIDLIGDFITVQLGYLIAKKVNSFSENNIEPPGFFTDFKGGSEFVDICTQIANKKDKALEIYYTNFHLLKCMCFILHDKPVDAFVEILYDKMYKRCDAYARFSGIDLSGIPIKDLWDTWRGGFSSGSIYKATQERCHNTLDNLTKIFSEFMAKGGIGIHVPKKLVLFSVPRSSMRSVIADKELKQILAKFKYGLADATGNDEWINKYSIVPISLKTTAFQNAAPSNPPKSGQHYPIEEDISIDGEVYKPFYKIDMGEVLNTTPLRFGDLCIYHVNEPSMLNFYYASIDSFSSRTYLRTLIKTGLEGRIRDIHKKIDHLKSIIQDEGVDKILIAVVNGPISQNETIPLIKEICPDMVDSARGAKIFSEKAIRSKLWWLEVGNTDVDTEIRILLSAFLKEAGDQSKIQVVENLSRNNKKSYVSTVDSYISESIVNGGVLFKGGNVIFSEQEGFDVLTVENKNKLGIAISDMRKYTYDKFLSDVKNFIEHLRNQLLPVSRRFSKTFIEGTDRKYPLYFTYIALLKNLKTIIPLEDEFNKYIQKFDRNLHTGIDGILPLVRRLLKMDTVNDIFAIYNNHRDNRFTTVNARITSRNNLEDMIFDSRNVSRNNLQDMIIDYCNLYYGTDSFSNEMFNLFESTPLYFLFEEIPKLENVLRFRNKRNTKVVPYTAYLVELRTSFIQKFNAFNTKYDIGKDPEEMWKELYQSNPYFAKDKLIPQITANVYDKPRYNDVNSQEEESDYKYIESSNNRTTGKSKRNNRNNNNRTKRTKRTNKVNK